MRSRSILLRLFAPTVVTVTKQASSVLKTAISWHSSSRGAISVMMKQRPVRLKVPDTDSITLTIPATFFVEWLADFLSGAESLRRNWQALSWSANFRLSQQTENLFLYSQRPVTGRPPATWTNYTTSHIKFIRIVFIVILKLSPKLSKQFALYSGFTTALFRYVLCVLNNLPTHPTLFLTSL